MSGVLGEGVGPISSVQGRELGPMSQCITGNGHIGTPPLVDKVTDKHL